MVIFLVAQGDTFSLEFFQPFTAEKMGVALNARVFKTKIRQAVALSENVGKHIGITSYSPKSIV